MPPLFYQRQPLTSAAVGVKHFLAAARPRPGTAAAAQASRNTAPPVRRATDGSIIEQFPYHPGEMPRRDYKYMILLFNIHKRRIPPPELGHTGTVRGV